MVTETKIVKNQDKFVESLYLRGLDALNHQLQTQISIFGLDPAYLHIHICVQPPFYCRDFKTIVTWPIPHEFLMKYLASSECPDILLSSWSWHHAWAFRPYFQLGNRKFTREVGRSHLWGETSYLDLGTPRLVLYQSDCGSDSPAVFQPGEIKSPQVVFIFVIIELKETLSASISSVVYKDPSYAKLGSFMYINQLLQNNSQKVNLVIRIYKKLISTDYDLSIASFDLEYGLCETRVFARLRYGDFDVSREPSTFLNGTELSNVFLVN